MSWDDDYDRYQNEEAMMEFLEDELRRLAEDPVFDYLAKNGDAIEERVRRCVQQVRALIDAGFAGAGLTRAAAGIEITVRFFLVRPLLQGAFLSNDWAICWSIVAITNPPECPNLNPPRRYQRQNPFDE